MSGRSECNLSGSIECKWPGGTGCNLSGSAKCNVSTSTDCKLSGRSGCTRHMIFDGNYIFATNFSHRNKTA